MYSSPELISVVITCYNHANYLSEAIESILRQGYQSREIIVIDDGSTDDTKEIALKFSEVRYFYQPNQGLAAARNYGISQSRGGYITFLDADDWFLPEALHINMQYLKKKPAAAFVSGAFKIFKTKNREELLMQTMVEKDHFNHLLEFNYISMHATVLYRRWVFDEFKFDTSLKACEDYDIFLKISRKYPVLHHTQFIAVYRFHDSNMSYDTVMMMNAAIFVIKKQEKHLVTLEQKESLKRGILKYKEFYSKMIYSKYFLAEQKGNPNRKAEMKLLWQNSKYLYCKFYLRTALLFLHILRNRS